VILLALISVGIRRPLTGPPLDKTRHEQLGFEGKYEKTLFWFATMVDLLSVFTLGSPLELAAEDAATDTLGVQMKCAFPQMISR